jgi:phospholipid/cholesterol/gamma-HCH transport system ATP-binding protein
MNSVMEIGEKIVFIHGGEKWWEGDNRSIMSADNEELSRFVFASSLAQRARAANL